MTVLGDTIATVLAGLFNNTFVSDLAGLGRNVTIKIDASPVYDATTGPSYTSTSQVMKAIRRNYTVKEVLAGAGRILDTDTMFLIYHELITEAALKPIKAGMLITGDDRKYLVKNVEFIRDPTKATATNLLYKAQCREGGP